MHCKVVEKIKSQMRDKAACVWGNRIYLKTNGLLSVAAEISPKRSLVSSLRLSHYGPH
jgi:hypothetical protein